MEPGTDPYVMLRSKELSDAVMVELQLLACFRVQCKLDDVGFNKGRVENDALTVGQFLGKKSRVLVIN
jgi:hypothetical protein